LIFIPSVDTVSAFKVCTPFVVGVFPLFMPVVIETQNLLSAKIMQDIFLFSWAAGAQSV
jgi:hypothetical protein